MDLDRYTHLVVKEEMEEEVGVLCEPPFDELINWLRGTGVCGSAMVVVVGRLVGVVSIINIWKISIQIRKVKVGFNSKWVPRTGLSVFGLISCRLTAFGKSSASLKSEFVLLPLDMITLLSWLTCWALNITVFWTDNAGFLFLTRFSQTGFTTSGFGQALEGHL